MAIEDKIRDICSRLGEQFPEYLIVVKTQQGKIAFKFSDVTWTMGACDRVQAFLHEAQEVTDAEDSRDA